MEQGAVDSQTRVQRSTPADERALLRTILDSLLNPLVVWAPVRDADGTVTDLVHVECNAAAAEYLNHPRDHIVGRRMRELFEGDSARWVFKMAVEVLESGRPAQYRAMPLVPEDTTDERLFDISMARIDDGVSATWRDVTEEFTAGQALRDSQEELRVAMDTAPVAMNLVSNDGTFLRVIPAMCEFLGRDEQTLRTTDWQSLTHPDDLAPDLALVQQVIDGRRDSYRLTKRFIRPDDSIVWGDLSVAGIRDHDGDLKYFIAQILDITELVRGREELAASREHYRMLAEHTSDVVMQVSRRGILEWVSPSVADVFGWNRDEVVGKRVEDFVSQTHWGAVETAMESSTNDGMVARGQFRVRRRGGQWLWVDATSSSVEDADGQLIRVVRVRNVDAEVRARIALKESEERFRAAMRATPIGVALIDREGQIRQSNEALARMLKVKESFLQGRTITSLTHPDDRGVDLALWNQLHGGFAASATAEKRLLSPRGDTVWVQNALAVVRDDSGEITSFVAQFLDITEKQQVHAALEVMAHKDPLTDLKNRRAVLEQMQKVLSHPPRTGWRLGVLYCDLDHFKRVNDVHGHAVGDELLVEVARRIQGALREGDTVGRLGGDEFLVLLTQVHGEESALHVAKKIRTAVHRPFATSGVSLTPSLSMGAAIADTGDDPDEVIAKADRALYAAKEAGRDRVVAFSEVES